MTYDKLTHGLGKGEKAALATELQVTDARAGFHGDAVE